MRNAGDGTGQRYLLLRRVRLGEASVRRCEVIPFCRSMCLVDIALLAPGHKITVTGVLYGTPLGNVPCECPCMAHPVQGHRCRTFLSVKCNTLNVVRHVTCMAHLLHCRRGSSLAHVAGHAALHGWRGHSSCLLGNCCRPVLLQAAHVSLHVPKPLLIQKDFILPWQGDECMHSQAAFWSMSIDTQPTIAGKANPAAPYSTCQCVKFQAASVRIHVPAGNTLLFVLAPACHKWYAVTKCCMPTVCCCTLVAENRL